MVTDVDLAAEQAVLELLRVEYPHFGILSEDSAPVETDSPYIWVVDPLDGSRNYANGVPYFCVVVALAQGNEMVLGVTYDPVRDELFTAERSKVAFRNGSLISVSGREEIDQALLGFDLGYVDEKAGLALDMIRTFWPGMQGIRLMGSSGPGPGLRRRQPGRFALSARPFPVGCRLRPAAGPGGRRCGGTGRGRPAGLRTPSVIASREHVS